MRKRTKLVILHALNLFGQGQCLLSPAVGGLVGVHNAPKTYRAKSRILGPTLAFRSTYRFALANSNDEETDDSNISEVDEKRGDGDISWIRESMDISNEDLDGSSESAVTPLEPGLAGFAVDQDLGFVCILARGDGKKITYSIISPKDVDKISSVEALCLVQLTGGLDLGAAVFPPETLARLVSEVENDDANPENIEELRSRLTLLAVTAQKNKYYSPKDTSSNNGDEEVNPKPLSSDERDFAIAQIAPKVFSAVKNLPGVGGVTTDQVIAALQLHADEEGGLDRTAFSQLLGSLREGIVTRIEDQKVSFQITVSLSLPSSNLKLIDIEDVPAFLAVALSLRYDVSIETSIDCFDDAGGDIIDQFPAFKPLGELVDDAKAMEDYISKALFSNKDKKQ
uniref:Uncharacterized protein n=1 Tax=Chaetoceros debilis TaxID=122233 RepID=A0A7S3VDP9_9STRA